MIQIRSALVMAKLPQNENEIQMRGKKKKNQKQKRLPGQPYITKIKQKEEKCVLERKDGDSCR